MKKLNALIDITVVAFTALVSGVRASGDPTEVIAPLMALLDLIRVIAAPLFIIAVTAAGYMYMTSGDNPEKQYKAKAYLGSCIVGAIIVLGAPLVSMYFFG